MIIGLISLWLYALFGLVGLILEIWAFADCMRHRSVDFQHADKRTKGFWGGITGAAAGVGILSLPFPIGPNWLPFFLGYIAIIAACVYLADVKPALKEVRGYRGKSSGPYSW